MSDFWLDRRAFAVGAAVIGLSGCATSQGETPMHGLIGKMTAAPGQRDALIAVLLKGVSGMPGCLSYVVAKDPADAEAIWITEVWKDEASHKASLSMPSVQEAIKIGRPMIAGFGPSTVTLPVGGHGLHS
ncbi:MAG: putative quinol monooxygenase [Caulobacterales bacterium]